MKDKIQHVVALVVIAIVVILIAVLMDLKMQKHEHEFDDDLKLEIINTSTEGWAYRILYHEKTIIYQKSIPALAGNTPFSSFEDAEKIGSLVMERLKSRKSPSITRADLEELGIEGIN